jgi:glucose dehydrogenase
LFFSPWLFDLPAGAPRETALIIGLVIAASSIAALAAYAGWEEWLNLIAGLGLIAAPWLLVFENKNAITLYTVIGTLVFAFAALELWFTIGRQQRDRTSQS